MRILIAEDEKKVAHFIRKALKQAGHAVDEVHDGNEALELALTTPYDAIVLDIMMPGRDGLSVLRLLRKERTNTPVLLLTARGEVSERIEGLDLGADDYMAKPFAMGELIARVNALTRRASGERGTLLRVDDLVMNLLSREVHASRAKHDARAARVFASGIPDALAGTRAFPHEYLRACVGPPFRYRNERRGRLYPAPAPQDRRRPRGETHPHHPRSGLHAEGRLVKNWSLRAKLIGWSALVVGVALVICCAGAGVYVQQEQIEALDDQIRDEAEMFFREFRQNRSDVEKIRQMLPTTPRERFIEILSTDGARLYRSENLRQDLAYFSEGMHRVAIGRHATRLGIFKRDGITLCIAIDLSEINQDIKELILGFAGALPLLMGIVIFGGWWIARKALAPIQEITNAAEQITAQHLDRRLPVSPSRDEIGRLASVLNETFDRLDRSFRQAARFSADASHELKTPLDDPPLGH